MFHLVLPRKLSNSDTPELRYVSLAWEEDSNLSARNTSEECSLFRPFKNMLIVTLK